MLGEVIERAAELAEAGEPTIDAALARYEQSHDNPPRRNGHIWVSVAFLLSRHAVLSRLLPS